MQPNEVLISRHKEYDANRIGDSLPDSLFESIEPGQTVILKPNWIRESHLTRPGDWDYVITHPAVITAVMMKVISRLGHHGKIVITDGPETASSFSGIMSHYPVEEWKNMAQERNIAFEIIDLRDDEWILRDDVVIERKKLPGDPAGSTEVNLEEDRSEFFGHRRSEKGYYGADSDISETNRAHDGHNNLYRVSRTVLQGDVFINLPKLKTHKKAGITASLKNLVGINTYKNFLPHNSIGTSAIHGDQFPEAKMNSRIESTLMPFIHQHILRHPAVAKLFRPVMMLGKKIFGDNQQTIRGGSWHGNDTLWRMTLDLNKILFYANPDGSLREDHFTSVRKYITIVDGILAGQGNGPKSPDPVCLGYVIAGLNPAAVDAVCARMMGFDPRQIPSISNAFKINRYPVCSFRYEDINIRMDENIYAMDQIPLENIVHCKPHFGWVDHIEYPLNQK
jgi:uncharacterized protein (DUF362 family)